MWQTEDIIIISDLHLAAERNKGLFLADAELAGFFSWVLNEVRQGVVALNGDIFDFLVTATGETSSDTFDLSKVSGRARQVIEHHPEVFDSLAALAQSSCHDLWIMGGNHDPEMILPNVRWQVEKRLSPSRSVPPIRWLINGEGGMVSVGEAAILIEHGDIYDSWNRIDHESLRRELMLASRGLSHGRLYSPPPGSRLVVNHLSELRDKYGWVDILKPERETVIPLLYAFANAKQKYRLRGAIKELVQVGRRSFLNKVRRNPASLYRKIQTREIRSFERWATDVERNITRKASHETELECEIDDLIPKLRRVSAEDTYFDVGVPDSAADDVTFLMENGADVVVNGHTHAAKACKIDGKRGLYLNTGTWAQLMRLPESGATDESWRKFLLGLSEGTAKGFCRPTFVRLTHARERSVTEAGLFEWSDGKAKPLSEWKFDSRARAWKEKG